jgi:hypothetical protein
MADGVQRALSLGVAELGRRAWRRVRDEFSLERFGRQSHDAVQDAASSAPRPWPACRPSAFTGPGGSACGSGTVPADAGGRMQRLLASLAGRRIVLHGSGRHTIELAGVLAASRADIAAIADDDPGRWGQRLLGWEITDPSRVGELGVTDAVISSALHAEEIYARRAAYERQGVRVHHLYKDVVAPRDSYTPAACTS